MKLANLGEEIVKRSRDKERKTSKGIKMMRENSAFQTDMYIFVCLYILMYIYIYIYIYAISNQNKAKLWC